MSVHAGIIHIFTGRTTNPSVSIKAAPGETLNIEGLLNGSVGGTPDLENTSTSTLLGYKQLSTSSQTIQDPDTTNLKHQGDTISLSQTGNYLAFSGYNQTPLPDVGKGSVWLNTSGSYAFQANLSIGPGSSIAKIGKHIAINEDGSHVVIHTETNSGDTVSLFTRSGTTWTFNLRHINGLAVRLGNVSINGDLAIAFLGYGTIEEYNYSAGAWTFTTITLDESLNFEDYKSGDLVGTDTLILNRANLNACDVYRKVSSTWTFLQRLTPTTISDSGFGRYDLSFIKAFKDLFTTVYIASNNGVYIYDNRVDSNVFVLDTFIADAGLLAIQDISNTKFVTVTGTVIKVYTKDTTHTAWKLASSKTVTGTITAMGANETKVVIGRSAADGGNGQLESFGLEDVSPEIAINVNTISVDDEISLNSIFPVRVDSGIQGNYSAATAVTGDLSVSGRIRGSTQSHYARIIGGTQSILNNTDTKSSLYVTEQIGTKLSTNSTSSIIVKQTGCYFISASCVFTANATGLRTLKVKVNGTSQLQDSITASTEEGYLSISGSLILNSNDEVELYVVQTSGTSLNLSSTLPPSLKLAYLSG